MHSAAPANRNRNVKFGFPTLRSTHTQGKPLAVIRNIAVSKLVLDSKDPVLGDFRRCLIVADAVADGAMISFYGLNSSLLVFLLVP